MARSVLYMWMSLDGYIAGPDDDVGQALGRGGNRLHASLGYDGTDETVGVRPPGPSGEVFDELMATKAVLVGRRTFDIAGHWDGDHHDGVPIFVPTHHPPADPPPGRATITYVTDGIESAVAQAKAAAGDRNVMFHGAETAQDALRAGVLDEMELHVMPVLLGRGRRLFDHLGADPIELELTRSIDAPGVTHLHDRVLR